MIKQRTIKKSVKARGIGIHSGNMINMSLIPGVIKKDAFCFIKL
ncbi:MAG: hypothetical protein FXV79_03365 [Candidatus Thioglobus sp.]|nr:MAG: hypothetical protein FXV79_03365 [Candidatus Thioglobus sp.]